MVVGAGRPTPGSFEPRWGGIWTGGRLGMGMGQVCQRARAAVSQRQSRRCSAASFIRANRSL